MTAVDILGYLLIAVGALVLLDLVVGGGAATRSCAGAAVGVMTHPATWLVVVLLAVILLAGFGAVAWR